MRHVRLLTAALITIAATTLAACGDGSPGQSAAQDACKGYANTGRKQVATTVEGADAIRATVRADARRAATADRSWSALQRDIADAYSGESTLLTATASEVDAYFAADRRVEADCKSAGEDIGPLQP